MAKQLIVNADDFGMSPAVSQGILLAHHDGIVTSTTVMIGMPGAFEAVRAAVTSAPRLGLGLHITIASYRCPPVLPPAEVPTLVREDGCFYDNPVWGERYDSFDHDEMRREVEAQCARFIEAAGRPPDHLDSHYHAAYLHPAALRATFDIALRYGIPIRRPLANTANLEEGLQSRGIGHWYAGLKPVFEQQPLPRWAEHFIDLRPTMTPEEVTALLASVPESGGTEMLCHPGLVDAILESADTYTSGREAEVHLLTHPAVKAAIAGEGIELIPFSALKDVS